MRTGPYAIAGLPSLTAGTAPLLERPQSEDAAFAGALLAGGSALVWLGISGRRVGRIGWTVLGFSAGGA